MNLQPNWFEIGHQVLTLVIACVALLRVQRNRHRIKALEQKCLYPHCNRDAVAAAAKKGTALNG